MTVQEFWMIANHRLKRAKPEEEPMTRETFNIMVIADKAGKLGTQGRKQEEKK